MAREDAIYAERFGNGAKLLVLVHGQNANGDVWNGLRPYIERDWRGSCLVPDLRGHGRSFHRPPYAYGTFAADIASLIPPGEEVFLIGHSLGGAVSLMLATGWFGTRVRGVFAFGIKVNWSDEELARRRQFAAAPVRWFDTRETAIQRYLKVSGQFGLVDPASFAAASGIAEANGRFRLAADPRIAGSGDPPAIRHVFAAAKAPVTLAVGERDAMVPLAEASGLDPRAAVIPGAGHNAHVENPEGLWNVISNTTIFGDIAG
ncbi:MAG: alpha/beta fold hydrolase [Stellaceae bacterium]